LNFSSFKSLFVLLVCCESVIRLIS
jgi:hypothetical protein